MMLLLDRLLHRKSEAPLPAATDLLLRPGRASEEAREARKGPTRGDMPLHLAQGASAFDLHQRHQYDLEVLELRLAEGQTESLSELTKGRACTDNRNRHGSPPRKGGFGHLRFSPKVSHAFNCYSKSANIVS